MMSPCRPWGKGRHRPVVVPNPVTRIACRVSGALGLASDTVSGGVLHAMGPRVGVDVGGDTTLSACGVIIRNDSATARRNAPNPVTSIAHSITCRTTGCATGGTARPLSAFRIHEPATPHRTCQP